MEDLPSGQTAVDEDNDNDDEAVPNDTGDQDASENDVAGAVPVDKEDDAPNDDSNANIQAQPESSDLEPLSIPEQVRDEDEPIPLVEAEDTPVKSNDNNPEEVVKDSQDQATNDVTNDNPSVNEPFDVPEQTAGETSQDTFANPETDLNNQADIQDASVIASKTNGENVPSVNEPFDVPELTPEEIPQADANQNAEFIAQNDANPIPENNAEAVPQDARNHHITVYSETGNTPGEFQSAPAEKVNDEFSMEDENENDDDSDTKENYDEDRQNVRALGNLNQDMLYDALKYESLKDHIDLDEDEHETVAKISKDVLLRLVKKFSEQEDDKDDKENDGDDTDEDEYDELTAQNVEGDNKQDDEINDPRGRGRWWRRRHGRRRRNLQRRRTTRVYPIVTARKAEVIAFLQKNGQTVEIGVRSLIQKLKICCKAKKCSAEHEFCKLVLPPVIQPTVQPTVQPSVQPTMQPTVQPSVQPKTDSA
eukprot:TCONS_00032944-protein